LPVLLAKAGPRLDWPHIRTDDRASRAWTRWAQGVARRRWIAAGAAMTVIAVLVVAATSLQLGTANADAIAKPGEAKNGLVPLKAVLLNVLSVAAAWGVMVLVWQHGYGSDAIWGIAATGSIPSWMPLMVFAFLFGLSMDYEVFILARMREEFDATGSTDAAVV